MVVMGENLFDEEASILKDAETSFRDLPQASEDIAQSSLTLLSEERELFDQAMISQLAFIGWATRGGLITDDGLRASIAIASYTFDMLLCGWNSLIRGFYSVAYHFGRSIEQATVTAVAVTLDPKIAQKFWDENLSDGEANKALQSKIAEGDADYAEEWGEIRKLTRDLQSKFMHISRTAITTSFLIAADGESMAIMVGGLFVENQCQRIGRLYATLAFNAAVNITYAFRSVLPPPNGKLKHQFDELVEFGKPLKDRWDKELIDKWEKEMGFS